MQRNRSLLNRQRSLRNRFLSNRAGFSIWDLLAVVIVLAVLIALVTPQVGGPRASARRLQCLNNLKNVTLAVHIYASGAEGQLPLLEDGTYGWPIELLPSLDCAAVYREYKKNGDSEMTQLWIQTFTCPKDSNNDQKTRGLSYAANAGYGNFRVDSSTGAITQAARHTADIDWDGDGNIDEADRAVSRASGVFWRGHDDGFRMTLDYIEQGDGLGQTILFAENLNARNWASRNTMDIAFVIGRDASGLSGKPSDIGPLRIQTETLGAFGINGNDGSFPGRSPVPSANHQGTVNVAFCDGRAQAMSDDIDPRVYARLVTPNGMRFGQSKVGTSEY